MNEFEKEIAAFLGQENFDKVQSVKVGIAGAGGLGSNCAFNLVRTGFKRLKIIDYDKVEISNLNRQFYFSDQVGKTKVRALKENLLRINPDSDIEILAERIERDNVKQMFLDCSIVVEAFDKAEYKSMLVEELSDSTQLIVSASGIAGMANSDAISINKLRSNLIVIGDLKSDTKDFPPLAPRVSLSAAKQANEILNYVVNK